jgi:hypothetical protein
MYNVTSQGFKIQGYISNLLYWYEYGTSSSILDSLSNVITSHFGYTMTSWHRHGLSFLPAWGVCQIPTASHVPRNKRSCIHPNPTIIVESCSQLSGNELSFGSDNNCPNSRSKISSKCDALQWPSPLWVCHVDCCSCCWFFHTSSDSTSVRLDTLIDSLIFSLCQKNNE